MSLVIGLQSQSINRLSLTLANGTDTTLVVTSAAFGNNDGEVSGNLSLGMDSQQPQTDCCTPIINTVSESIVLIDRGQCQFIDKGANAQGAGAIAMIVCNNIEDPTFVMGGDAPEITIACVMASLQDCELLKLQLEDSPLITLDYYDAPCVAECATLDYPENTVWGQNGEGAFACGLGEWTTQGITNNDTTIWKWDADTTPVGQSGAPRAVESITKCNGAAQMDFCDYNFNSVNGPSTEIYFKSDLISPIIDLSNVESPVIRFDQYLYTLFEGQEIAYFTQSLDGGVTWLDTIPIKSPHFNVTNGFNITQGNQKVKFPIHGNTSECLIKFIANGNFYFWTIDDVYITDEEIPRISLDKTRYSRAPNYKTPFSHLDEIPFMVNVRNTGNVDMLDVSWTATITKDGEELYSTTQNVGTVPKLSERVSVAPDTWPMERDLGEYLIKYSLDASNMPEDIEEEDITITSKFRISALDYSKMPSEYEAGQQYLVGIGQEATYATYATSYYINDSSNIPDKLTSGFGSDILYDLGPTLLTGEVREWLLDSNGDGLINLETETRLIAQGETLIDPNNPIDLRCFDIDLALVTANSELEVGQYIALIHVAPQTTPSTSAYIGPLSSGINSGHLNNRDYSYTATDFAFAELGMIRLSGSYYDFNGTSGSQQNQGARNLEPASNPTHTYYIDMSLQYIINTVDISKEIDLSIFPNPAKNEVIVDVNLTEVSKSVNVQIVDISGKRVASNNFTNIKDSTLNINTTALASGVYMINVFTDNGVKTERILIQK